MIAAAIILFALGLVVGSFLNVCIYRLPREESIAWPASHCTTCNRTLRWYEDHRISGAKTLKQPEFRGMIRDAEERGDFKAILCWDQDRFGRFDSIDAGQWV